MTKNVLITGANRGIGLGLVKHYLAAGEAVWACHRADAGELQRIDHPNLHTLRWDVTEAMPDDTLDKALLPARLDLLINNAGTYGSNQQSLADISAEDLLNVFNINTVAPMIVTKTLLPRLIRAQGTIANMSSKMGSVNDNTSGGAYAYRASKSALCITSRSLAVDLAKDGVQVITLHPGWVKTDMTQQTGLIDVETSVAGLTSVIDRIDQYPAGAFVAYSGEQIPF